MAYRETLKYCRTCRRVTNHWADWREWREAPPPEPWQAPFVAVFRVIRKTVSGRWRCLDCDHPWVNSLLKKDHGVA